MGDFKTKRTGTGTREWSDISRNCGTGCKNGCVYCFAAWGAIYRYKRVKPDCWTEEKVNMTKAMKKEPYGRDPNQVAMYPTQHDITEAYYEASIHKVQHLLDAGYQVLIVTKPTFKIFTNFLLHFEKYKARILTRISLTSLDPKASLQYEPGASSPAERLDCLEWAFKHGYQTSLSCEPMLPSRRYTYAEMGRLIYYKAAEFVTDKIWYGTMNKVHSRIPDITPSWEKEIENWQQPSEVLKLVRIIQASGANQKVEWKDSVKTIILTDLYLNL
jgi:DNA repair photolyase